MIIPCIDLMGGKVVQLVQGRETAKVLELPDPLAALDRFEAFPQIQVIDLDAAMARGSNTGIVRQLAARKPSRVGGGVRSVERARDLVDQGVLKVIVGSAAFTRAGVNHDFLEALAAALPRERVMIAVDCLGDHVAIHGWKEVLPLTSGQVLPDLERYCSEFLCTCVDVEGQYQGTRLDWFRGLRERTSLPVTAAGGITTDEEIRSLEEIGMHAALGVAIYRRLFPELFPNGARHNSST